MTFIDESEISNLSDAQEMALSLLPIPSAILSILGSSIIIYLVCKAKNRGPYRRILLGMSICDLIISCAWALQGFLMPQETSQRVWAFGNDASCTAMGFLTQFAFSCFLYYGMLSYYYVLTIRWGVREETFSKRVEPWMHVISVGYPLVTATLGVAAGFFRENELGIGCWVNNYPENCGTDPTETGIPCKSPLIAWIIGGMVIMFILASLIVNNTLIYLHVRRTITRVRRFTVVAHQVNNNAVPTNNNNNIGRQQPDAQTRRVRAVAAQCFLYVAAFLIAYTWTIALRILEGMGFDAKDEASIYFLLVGQAIFGPLTGFLNLIIYLRPRYLRCRNDFAQESRWWAAKRALFGEKVERTIIRAAATNNNNINNSNNNSQQRRSYFLNNLRREGKSNESESHSTCDSARPATPCHAKQEPQHATGSAPPTMHPSLPESTRQHVVATSHVQQHQKQQQQQQDPHDVPSVRNNTITRPVFLLPVFLPAAK